MPQKPCWKNTTQDGQFAEQPALSNDGQLTVYGGAEASASVTCRFGSGSATSTLREDKAWRLCRAAVIR